MKKRAPGPSLFDRFVEEDNASRRVAMKEAPAPAAMPVPVAAPEVAKSVAIDPPQPSPVQLAPRGIAGAIVTIRRNDEGNFVFRHELHPARFVECILNRDQVTHLVAQASEALS